MKQMQITGAGGTVARVGRSRLPVAYADAMDVAARLKPVEPVFCFDRTKLAERVQAFLAGFPGDVSYAVKANPSTQVLLTMAGAGLRIFDVASIKEIETVRRVAPRARLHYHNPIKARSEIATAYDRYGVRRFSADSAEEIAKIVAVTGGDPSVEIAVRFCLATAGNAVHEFSSKFGARPALAAELLRQVDQAGLIPLLTFHPGSQCTDPEAYRHHIETAAGIVRTAGVRIGKLNVGGGFAADYLPSPAPALSEYFRVIAEAMREHFGEVGAPRLECEPGRGMVATSISLLTRVKLVKSGLGQAFINDGIYGALMECYQAPKLQPHLRAIRDGKELQGETRPFVLFGPTCDSLDRLPNPAELPADLAEDDYIEFANLGAYGVATSTRFNGFGGAEVVSVKRVLSV
ncbi:MAG: type III PLP-dependent enzyme [Hyphomicrobiaceae bacterium]